MNRRKIIVKLLIVVLVTILLSQIVLPQISVVIENGKILQFMANNEEESEYYINTAQDMWDFAEEVNNGNTFNGITVYLTADIDLGCTEENQWETMGGYSYYYGTSCFEGTFDGKGYKITGLYINNDKECQGLFGSNKGTLKNIICEGTINTSNSMLTGGLVAYNDNGNIYNCHSYVNILADGFKVGGIVGGSIRRDNRKM